MPIRQRSFIGLGVAAGLLLGLLFVRSVTPEPSGEWPRQATAVNLALRRTAHLLLQAAGDSVSRIPAVEQSGPHTFRLRFAQAFDYDRLPSLLSESLRQQQITLPYDVAVQDCHTHTLQLGYSVRDLTDTANVPCTGRAMPSGCYVVQITFAAQKTPSVTYWPVLVLAGLLIGIFVAVGRRRPAPSAGVVAAAPAHRIHFGRSWLDVAGQQLMAASTPHNLTYRETKLLRLLASHPNQILERSRILELVWQDEGIIVGRSVDVFVSRLRKLLTDDPTLRISSIHGVGYRLEVTASEAD